MPAERYYINARISANDSVALEGQEFHHLAHVMRSTSGEAVELVNGEGCLAHATIQKMAKKYAELKILESSLEERPSFQLILAQAIPRPNRLDFILEKGTELGMTDIYLFPTVLNERKTLTDHQLERMKMIMIAAMKQCGRLYLPKIKLLPQLLKWKSLDLPSFFGDTAPKAPSFFKIWSQHKPKKGTLFFIGPESGFTSNEIHHLKDLHAHGVKLHSNILRTDTASLCALSLIEHWLMVEKE